LIIAAAAGAIAGDNIRRTDRPPLRLHAPAAYGHLVRLDAPRLKLGQFLFARHGGKVVFLGRFIAGLRALAALLAGINCMGWRRFLFFNASGGIVWAAAYGFAAYVFGERLESVRGAVAMTGIVAAVLACAGGFWWMRRHEAALQAEAERALPGPLTDVDGARGA
jgi:membrane protein DedA with SNARE-associated domain